eukprot:1579942-Prymnesium_polylepis.2
MSCGAGARACTWWVAAYPMPSRAQARARIAMSGCASYSPDAARASQVLENVADPHNSASVLRAAEACGVQH